MTEIRSSMIESADEGGRRLLDRIVDQRDLASFTDGQVAMVKFAQDEARHAIAAKYFRLNISFFIRLHLIGYSFIDQAAGQIRSQKVFISNSSLKAPPPNQIVPLLEEMCEYVNDNWEHSSPIHLAAYVMWRFLWIHPFIDGNGSIARIASYSVIQIKKGEIISGQKLMFQLIADHRREYYEALSEADMFWDRGELNVEKLEVLLSTLLTEQLASVSVA